jgi:RNA polymerase sigma factor (sigma-70 family)
MPAPRALLAAIRFPPPGDDATDAELLGRFADHRDAAAFDALVRRHARLVWGVCRRTLGPGPDAEDAFQATFLVLARRPGRARQFGTAAGFLFGVARRVALKAATRANRPVPVAPQVSPADPAATAAFRELQTILDEEIGRLPDRYRLPFVLCVLEGTPRARAAAELGLNPGTLSARLARARLKLRDRLAGRGVSLAAVLAATDLAATAVPPGLTATAAGAATRAGGVGANVLYLASEGWWIVGKGKLLAAVAVLAVVGGMAGWAGGGPAEPAKAEPPKPVAEAKPAEPAKPAVGPPGGKLAKTFTIRARARQPVWSSDGDLVAVPYSATDTTGVVVYDTRRMAARTNLQESPGGLDGPPGEVLGFQTGRPTLVTRTETAGRVNVEPTLRLWNFSAPPNEFAERVWNRPTAEIGYEASWTPLLVRPNGAIIYWNVADSTRVFETKAAGDDDLRWQWDTEKGVRLGAATDPAGKVVVVFRLDNDADFVAAVDATNGRESWKKALPREPLKEGHKWEFPSPRVWVSADGKAVYFATPAQRLDRERKVGRGQTVPIESERYPEDQQILVFDAASGREVRRVTFKMGPSQFIDYAAPSADGRLWATTVVTKRRSAPHHTTTVVWDGATGAALKSWPAGAEFAFAPDRETLAVVENLTSQNAPVGKSVLGLWDLSGLGR